MNKELHRLVVPAALTLSALVAGVPNAEAAKGYTWKGADGGSWPVETNWDDGSVPPDVSSGAPGSLDFAQFMNFSGTVTGAVGANTLDVGPGSSLTLDGSGFFSMINVGQDFAFNNGNASLTIGAGQVISATILNLGGLISGSGTLTTNGTFTTNGGITMDQSGTASSIIVGSGGEIDDSVSLTMAAGGLLQVGTSGKMVIGSSSGGGSNGALTINSGYFFHGEGTIAGNVIVNGTLQTFNAGWPPRTLTVTGNVTGTGSVQVVQEMDLNGAVGAGVTVSLFSDGGTNLGLLRLANPPAFAGSLGTMSTYSIIALTGLNFDQITQSANALTLTGGSATLTLAMTGDHSFQSFSLKPDAISGTDIVVGVGTPPLPAPLSDLDGDGRSDIVWYNTVTGENYVWLMDGIGIALAGTSQGYLPTVTDLNWKVVGVADVDGDRKADLIWRNTTNGQNYIWLMNGIAIAGAGTSQGYLPTVADPNWKIVGVADVNGDGKSDLIWRNDTTGENYVWLMNGVGIAGGGTSQGYLPTVANLNWKIVGVADVNGDGKADLIWRNDTTGENYVWLMDGVAIAGGGTSQGYLPTVANLNWKIVGVADVSGDGKSDLIWRNDTTGENYVWLMDGIAIAGGGTSQGYLPTVADLNWKIVGVADVDGDLKADLIWRNSVTGENYVWLMNGIAIAGAGTSQGYLPTVANLNWQVQVK